ncbi:MAG: lamin tail domain-containing protein [Bacteroidota bacterium]
MFRLVSRGVMTGTMLMCYFITNGQVREDFADGDFSNDPTWVVSNKSGTDDFVIIDGVLQSRGPGATDNIWISTNGIISSGPNTISWTFDVRYSSPPSGSNNIKVFLQSTKPDLTSEPVGYFIQLGESGSNDGIDLMKTGSSEPLISDPNSSISSGIDLTIQVIREGNGNWFLKAGSSGGPLIDIGTALDNEYTEGEFFGFLVSHTRTRNQDFEFDNIEITVIDEAPPQLLEIFPLNANQVELRFSEVLSAKGAENVQSYFINGVHPRLATLDTTGTRVNLNLTEQLQNGSTNSVIIENLSDLNGNLQQKDSSSFVYFLPVAANFRDIIISEILADPLPQNDLPAVEFVELHNRSDKIFDLSEWTFCDASQCAVLESWLLFPGQYIVLCDQQQIDEFNDLPNVMGLENWPTLNNSGDDLKIRDDGQALIDSLSYSDRWFESSSKREGGWSLELIDVNNFCSDENNWIGSIESKGGTPGAVNSVNSVKPDLNGPEVLQVLGYAEDSIIVQLNEPIEPSNLLGAEFLISPNVEIAQVSYLQDLRLLSLSLGQSLLSDQEYWIEIRNLADCSGNVIRQTVNTFRLLETPEINDLVINEILFNPNSGGVDFVEIYNKSSKHLNINNVWLANFNMIDESEIAVSNFSIITDDPVVIQPKQYLAISTDDLVLSEQYPQSDRNQFLEVDRLPSMPDDAGSIMLSLSDTTVLDKFEYLEDYHSINLNDNEGVSLERISFDQPTQNRNNWTSAAAAVQFATPGDVNSQFRTVGSKGVDNVEVSPEIINLDDSQNDIATISYNFSQSGGLANIRVYDIQGRQIISLADNELLGFDGTFKWQGENESNVPVRTGYYIIYFEALFANGDIRSFKRKISVVRQF